MLDTGGEQILLRRRSPRSPVVATLQLMSNRNRRRIFLVRNLLLTFQKHKADCNDRMTAPRGPEPSQSVSRVSRLACQICGPRNGNCPTGVQNLMTNVEDRKQTRISLKASFAMRARPLASVLQRARARRAADTPIPVADGQMPPLPRCDRPAAFLSSLLERQSDGTLLNQQPNETQPNDQAYDLLGPSPVPHGNLVNILGWAELSLFLFWKYWFLFWT